MFCWDLERGGEQDEPSEARRAQAKKNKICAPTLGLPTGLHSLSSRLHASKKQMLILERKKTLARPGPRCPPMALPGLLMAPGSKSQQNLAPPSPPWLILALSGSYWPFLGSSWPPWLPLAPLINSPGNPLLHLSPHPNLLGSSWPHHGPPGYPWLLLGSSCLPPWLLLALHGLSLAPPGSSWLRGSAELARTRPGSPGGARWCQDEPVGARRSQEKPGGAMGARTSSAKFC